MFVASILPSIVVAVLPQIFSHSSYELREAVTLLGVLKRQIADDQYRLRKLANDLTLTQMDFAMSLREVQQRRLQVEQERKTSFRDDGKSPLYKHWMEFDWLGTNNVTWVRADAAILQGGNITAENYSVLLRRGVTLSADLLDLTAELRPLGGESDAGLIFRWLNDQNFHVFRLTDNRDFENAECNMKISRFIDGTEFELMKSRPCLPKLGTDYRVVEIRAEPRAIDIKIDGVPLGGVKSTMPVYHRGLVGLFAASGQTEFARIIARSGQDEYLGEPEQTQSKSTPTLNENGSKVPKKETQTSSDSLLLDQSSTKPLDKSKAQCFTYDPSVPHLGSWETSSGDWILRTPSQNQGLKGHQLREPSLTLTKGVELNKAQSLILRGWSCRHSQMKVTLTFLGDGEAGIIFRRHNDTLRHMLLFETLSQRVRVVRQTPTEETMVAQTISPVPIRTQASVTITVEDSVPLVTVTVADMPTMSMNVDDVNGKYYVARSGRSIPNYNGGLIITRGLAAFSSINFEGQ